MGLRDAIERLADESKISQPAREAVKSHLSDESEIGEASQEEVEAKIQGLNKQIDRLDNELEKAWERIERLEAEHDIRPGNQDEE